MATDDSGPRIKGSVIKSPRDWMRTSYGPEAYESALATLSPDERRLVDGPILAGSWFSLPVWDRFQAAMREEARVRRGHSDMQFNARNMREAGSRTVRTIYKFLLGMMSAKTTIEKSLILYNRVYSEGHFDAVENEVGRAVLRYSDASPAFRTNVTHNFPSGIMYLLEQCGAKRVDAHISRDQVVGGKLVFEVTVTYGE
jgi:hypothetical protein